MENQNKLKAYRNAIIFLVVAMFMYFFFAIGDLVIKGYSNLPSYPMIIGIVAIGYLIGLYLKERKNK